MGPISTGRGGPVFTRRPHPVSQSIRRHASQAQAFGPFVLAGVSRPRIACGFPVADRKDLEFTYSLIDRIVRLSLGELTDFSGAKYDGDFSLSLEQAQRRKHEYIAEQIGIGPGRRVLDVGCGWGPLLNFIREEGGTGVGVTLSSAQVAACHRHGLAAHLYAARK